VTHDSQPGRPHSIDRRLLDEVASIASRAGAAILALHPTDWARRDKPDLSPVTAADEASEAIVLDGLQRLLPGIPIISEEASEKAVPATFGDRFLLVDPLDGTRELLAGEADYAVNVALVDDGRPVLGVIAAPARQTIWIGLVGQGAERLRLAPGADVAAASERTAIRTRARPQRGAIALLSRFHRDAETDAYLNRFAGIERQVCGASLKFCRIAEGSADLYVRLASISEWDAAAGHALITAAGGAMTTLDGKPLPYGRPGLRLPHFIASGDATPSPPLPASGGR
jgi:3'(2'), 5'-bisphosphate nucleotidase